MVPCFFVCLAFLRPFQKLVTSTPGRILHFALDGWLGRGLSQEEQRPNRKFRR